MLTIVYFQRLSCEELKPAKKGKGMFALDGMPVKGVLQKEHKFTYISYSPK